MAENFPFDPRPENRRNVVHGIEMVLRELLAPYDKERVKSFARPQAVPQDDYGKAEEIYDVMEMENKRGGRIFFNIASVLRRLTGRAYMTPPEHDQYDILNRQMYGRIPDGIHEDQAIDTSRGRSRLTRSIVTPEGEDTFIPDISMPERFTGWQRFYNAEPEYEPPASGTWNPNVMTALEDWAVRYGMMPRRKQGDWSDEQRVNEEALRALFARRDMRGT